MIAAKERSKINFYPMELCYIESRQRAQIGQLSEREKSAMIAVKFYKIKLIKKLNNFISF